MSDRLHSAHPVVEHRRGRRRGASAAGDLTSERGIRLHLRKVVVTPALLVLGLLSAAWTVQAVKSDLTAPAVVVATLGCGLVLAGANRRMATTARVIREQADRKLRRQADSHQAEVLASVEHLESVVAQGRRAFAEALAAVQRGEQPSVPARPSAHPTGDPLTDLAPALGHAQSEAVEAMVALAARSQRMPESAEDERTAAFVFMARRLHALVSRNLEALSDLENGVEDPDLLLQLFRIDHLATLTRRAVENLGVLGGETPRRVIRPLLLTTVLRQAVAETEQYARVRVLLPGDEVYLPGYAGPDVIHLLAELVENAAKFSPPKTQVLMRSEMVPAGLAIEIEDRGLPMSPQRLAELNHLLASPQGALQRAQLDLGQIGLQVAARLAQRHGIRVELRGNLLGGTQALVVLPGSLLLAAEGAKPDPEHRTSPIRATPATRAGGDGVEAGSSVPAAFPLVQRQSGPATTPDFAVRPAFGDSTGQDEPLADGRPTLPRRSRAAHAAPREASSHRTAPAGPPNAGLMARYKAGVRHGEQEIAADGSPLGRSSG